MEQAIESAMRKAAAEKEAALLDATFELQQEEAAEAASKVDEAKSDARNRNSSVALGINNLMEEYPEELRDLIFADDSLE
mmetsp:Transcript_24152/g.35301  ORF Transcript_24152/g.35301 Transcript_24152/m.35301 type:complete len:80 (-) Transcript_24152:29-268(-)